MSDDITTKVTPYKMSSDITYRLLFILPVIVFAMLFFPLKQLGCFLFIIDRKKKSSKKYFTIHLISDNKFSFLKRMS